MKNTVRILILVAIAWIAVSFARSAVTFIGAIEARTNEAIEAMP